jgi:hypothetical protein
VITKENELRRQHKAAARSKQRNAEEQTAVFHNKQKEMRARRKQIRRATEELAKEMIEREAVDKGDETKDRNGNEGRKGQ